MTKFRRTEARWSKRRLGKLASISLAAALALSVAPSPVFADEAQAIRTWSQASAASDADGYSAYSSDGAASVAQLSASSNSKADLREKHVVTPVKNQGTWNTCWAFAGIAAAETSILSELGQTAEESGLDLSERYLAWFAYAQATAPLASAAQVGEGFENTGKSPSLVLKNGGVNTYIATLFSAGVGPVAESVAPYKNDKDLVECAILDDDGSATETYYLTPAQAEEFAKEQKEKGNKYSVGETYAAMGKDYEDFGWGLDSSLYGQSEYTLEHAYLLPEVRKLNSDGSYAGVSKEGIDAVKDQISQGRAVATSYQPGNEDEEYPQWAYYIDFETWSVYTDTVNAGGPHAVTIVGYDDNYPASNFKEGKQPPANGAFLVKNSRGASANAFPNGGNYGIKDEEGNHTGYFWLSYYDQTIDGLAAFDFDVNSETSDEEFSVDQYDFMPVVRTVVKESSQKVSSANVFMASDDRVLRAVSCETAKPNTKVTYEVYLLDETAKNPTDGVLVLAKNEEYAYGGYHRLMLASEDEGDWVAMRNGQRYSVVVTQWGESADGDKTYYQVSGKSSCYISDPNIPAVRYGDFVAKVNEGESWSCEADGEWTDWTKVIEGLEESGSRWKFDNLPIKAFSQERSWATVSELDELKAAVERLQSFLAKTKVSVDGSDVSSADTWITQQRYEELSIALAAAQEKLRAAGKDYATVLANTTPSSDEVNAAVSSLAFDEQYGTKASAAPEGEGGDQSSDGDKTHSAKTCDTGLPATAALGCLAAVAAASAAAARRRQRD